MKHLEFAPKPPLGWNSYDCFGSDVTEAEIRANAEFIAKNMKDAGWQYVVVDFCWSHPSPGACANPHIGHGCIPLLATDLYGRLVPAPNRFPSSAGGKGFKPLADYVHSLGLKFGIHVMRGIPKQVCTDYTPIEDSKHNCIEASTGMLECSWLDHMYTVNTKHPAGQAYYDSLLKLYASWDVDFIKVDDILADGSDRGQGPYHASEVEAIRKAIDKCGRPIVLSLSPGDAAISTAGHLKTHANMWRMSADFWDDWKKLKRMFTLCEKWFTHVSPGAWPDADMLPVGRICIRGPKTPDRDDRFTPDERKVLMALWCVFRSPLMVGGNLPQSQPEVIALLANKELINVNQSCEGARPVALCETGAPVWVSNYIGSADKALALFNLKDEEIEVSATLASIGINGGAKTRCIFGNKDLGAVAGGVVKVKLAPHSAALLRVTPV